MTGRHNDEAKMAGSSCAADARTTRQPPVHSAGSPRPSAPAEPSGPPGAETRPRSHTCATCGDPIVLDRVFGWLHTDRPDGQSHNHDAQRSTRTFYASPRPESRGEREVPHRTTVWDDDGIWSWSCICGASGAGWPTRDEARDEAAQHFWSDPRDLGVQR